MRSNPDPNPPLVVDGPEKLLRKLKSSLPKIGTQKLVRITSLLDQLFTPEDLSFDIQFKLSLFQSKSEYFLSKVVFDPIKFDSYLPTSKSLFYKLDHELWLNFDQLQGLADQLQITTEKAYIKYQLEIFSTTTSSTIPSNTSATTFVVKPPLPHQTSSSPSMQPIVVPVQLPPIVMARFSPLELPGQLAALP